MSDFWNTFEQADREESGGGGIVGLVHVRTGYKVYASGADQEESFFDAPASNKKARAEAKAKATLYANEHGANQARWSVLLHVPADSAIRVIDGEWQGVTWQADRYFVTNTWTSACKEVVVPSLKNAGVTDIPCSIWARIGFQPDPYKVELGDAGKTDADQDGNPRFPQVAYIVEQFSDLDAARVACGLETSDDVPDELKALAEETLANDDGPPLPSGWESDPAVWRAQMVDNKKALGPLPKARITLSKMADSEVVSLYGASAADVLAWYGEV